jgi:hypothetical protein
MATSYNEMGVDPFFITYLGMALENKQVVSAVQTQRSTVPVS